jgi:hypothetical protein
LVHGRDWVFVPDDERGAEILGAFENREMIDTDYGRLLDRAVTKHARGGTSPTGFVPDGNPVYQDVSGGLKPSDLRLCDERHWKAGLPPR